MPIWEGCEPEVHQAIEQFKDRWGPYSLASKRYHILRLIREGIDPVIATYVKTLPSRYSSYILGISEGMSFSEMIRLISCDAMVRLQRQLLRHFVITNDRQGIEDRRFIATAESLIDLVWDCACKQPKKTIATAGISLNDQRRHGFCELCGELTEFTAFLETIRKEQIHDAELENRKKLELSHQFCPKHRPILANGDRNPVYRQAKRSIERFKYELGRLERQCTDRHKPKAASSDPLVDRYFQYYLLSQTIQAADKAELRKQARLMVDYKLSDRKKQMLVLQKGGFTQPGIAHMLGISRQAVSKALAMIPDRFQFN
ncbi:hypothetical protein [Carnimonas bestiolae]|uniref:hypothetical protein n=1 Tax=Carnimonas bestiolae TaxID=3402172 RepID=UPI003EDBC494